MSPKNVYVNIKQFDDRAGKFEFLVAHLRSAVPPNKFYGNIKQFDDETGKFRFLVCVFQQMIIDGRQFSEKHEMRLENFVSDK